MKKIIFLCLPILLFFLSFGENQVSAKELDVLHFSPASLKTYTNGLKIEREDWGPDTYSATIDAGHLKKGYYTASFYDSRSRSWANYGAMVFHITNPNKEKINFNFSVNTGGQKIVQLQNGQYAALTEKNKNVWVSTRVQYGAFIIPAGFDGEIYIPFSSLGKEDKPLNRRNIVSWGINFTLEGGQTQKVQFGHFSLVDEQSADEQNAMLDKEIVGDEYVQIPVAGESIAKYTIRSAKGSEGGTLQLQNPIDGVHISKDGTLTLTLHARPQTIQLTVVAADGSRSIRNIHLIKSWTIGKKAGDGLSLQIPLPDKAPKNINTSTFLFDDQVTHLIRYAVVIASILLVLIYFWCRIGTRNKYRD